MASPAALPDVEQTLERTLAGWAAGSVLVGGLVAAIGHANGSDAARQFGRQTAAWGAVDGVIAAVGSVSRRRRGDDEGKKARARRLRRLLLINAAADVGYIAGGLVVALRGRDGSTTVRLGMGDGLAIVVQGGFLLVLDLSQARRLAA